MVPHFRDESYRDVKTPGYNVRECILQGLNLQGRNIWGRIVPVPLDPHPDGQGHTVYDFKTLTRYNSK
jgi:hypothetical protein